MEENQDRPDFASPGGGFVDPPKPTDPLWFRVVIAVLSAIGAIAGAYAAAQSAKNGTDIQNVHAVQKEDAARIDEIHQHSVPKSQLPPRQVP